MKRIAFLLAISLVVVSCTTMAGTSVEVRTLVHDPAIAAHRIDRAPGIEERVTDRLVELGAVRVERLGRGTVVAGRLPAIMAALETMLAAGETIYDLPVQR